MTETEILEHLRNAKKRLMPSVDQICAPAIDHVLRDRRGDRDWIKAHFSELTASIESQAHKEYLLTERKVAASALREVLEPLLGERRTSSDLFDLIERNFKAIDALHLSLSQGRKARAGKTFEQIIRTMFESLRYPYTQQAIINGQPDFLLPSLDHWRLNPMDCIIFTAKRTLRERWRQITTEGTRGHQFFLATIDAKIGTRDLREMLDHRIYLVVPAQLCAECYSESPNVISFERFFAQHLDPAMARWVANGVLPG